MQAWRRASGMLSSWYSSASTFREAGLSHGLSRSSAAYRAGSSRLRKPSPFTECSPHHGFRSTAASFGVMDNMRSAYDTVMQNSEDGAFAIGSRKRSRAKVWIRTGSGHIVVNDRTWVDYFQRLDHRDKVLRPFGLVNLMGKVDVTCEVQGGGTTGQAEAVRHGISRALQNWDPLLRPILKTNGLLTRDRREVESKKYGRKKARKAFQWVKR